MWKIPNEADVAKLNEDWETSIKHPITFTSRVSFRHDSEPESSPYKEANLPEFTITIQPRQPRDERKAALLSAIADEYHQAHPEKKIQVCEVKVWSNVNTHHVVEDNGIECSLACLELCLGSYKDVVVEARYILKD